MLLCLVFMISTLLGIFVTQTMPYLGKHIFAIPAEEVGHGVTTHDNEVKVIGPTNLHAEVKWRLVYICMARYNTNSPLIVEVQLF